MSQTKLLYLENFELLEAKSKVESVSTEDDKTVITLDQTIFYPQGGGQPCDQGTIESGGANFIVEEVRFVDGVVKHIGHFEFGDFTDGDEATGKVNAARRQLHSRLHSAGHIVDMALNGLGINWMPVKGYHFPEGPYVEYQGDISEFDKEKQKKKIETTCNDIIRKGAQTKLVFMDKSEMSTVCHHVPDYIPIDKPSRVVMYGDFGVPCGGTHVVNLKDIGRITIRKIKASKGNIRVAYDVEN
ncbi:MAG: hypothetical protein COT81_05595 [Candidatus Buchananbacteria bacterium CG10_big_fil_rev_8_21_14_0_10_42_9]|uniref:Alanyl-transfer RNA synthetases family profile domain-containing protein n=1 Tax=Candidatus Buchananbacteria bacterium CG10_big_fil_rev_8_21_14_0_10_42_9 TaxID=1974526 RepID=A0A2H0W1V7_9BACT|nr:MAG: hypothetical protein COT81_05595 [Candidatus Buchananbacteria bacterium CG10_big_fil_rev_8_21_14_0_10_42_9]